MSALSRTRWRRARDRGAVAVTVTVLLASGALLGFAALAVDVGTLYAEREELQTGADAAALAVAKACATESRDGCISGERTSSPFDDVFETAERYAELNASDRRANVVDVCGRDPGRRLHSCPPSPANLTRCIGTPPASGPYVEVRVSTETRSGSLVLPPVFAQTVAGGGTSVGACARASWSEVDRNPVAFALSICEYLEATADGITEPPNFTDEGEHVIFVHRTDPDDSCSTGPPSGWERPGEFGWIDGRDSPHDCAAIASQIASRELRTERGANWGECGDTGPGSGRLEELRGSGPDDYTVVMVPIVDGCNDPPSHSSDCNRGEGGDTELHLRGLAPFIITGYVRNASDRHQSWQTGSYPCSIFGEGCISGFFVGPLTTSVDPDDWFGVRPRIIG